MKDLRVHYLFLIVWIAAAAFGFFNVSTGRGQSRSAEKPQPATTLKPTLKAITSTRSDSPEATAPASTSIFESAALQNATLRNDLDWIFGGKSQKGWYLYTYLIDQLLKTDQDSISAGFAASLSKWQKDTGLTPNGVLDDQSLYSMISKWQSERLQDRTVASPDRLLTAPPSEFYDESRPDELRQVDKATYAAYHRMLTAAIADKSLALSAAPDGTLAESEKFLKIISAFRSKEYQEQLRKKSPNVGRAGLAINSPHFTGRALDLYVGGDPVDTNDANRALQVQTPVYKWLVKNAAAFGFKPYYYEPWHWEYVGEASMVNSK